MTARNRPFTREIRHGHIVCCPGPDRTGHIRPTSAAPGPSALSVRITSPLGRSGVPGSIRIVAQVRAEDSAEVGPVKFFVDGQLLQTDTDGAPYAVEWVDENPFERREIAVAVSDALGREIRDSVVLEPFEIIEETDVTSVMVEASVQDKNGRFVKALPQSAFSLLEDGIPQVLDLARHEAVGATLALLIDSSSSMSRRLDFVQRTAATLAQVHDAPGSDGRRAVLQGTSANDWTHRRQENGCGGDRCDSVSGGNRNPGFAEPDRAQLS